MSATKPSMDSSGANSSEALANGQSPSLANGQSPSLANEQSPSLANEQSPSLANTSDNGLSKDINAEANEHVINQETIENAIKKYIQVEDAVNHYVQSVQISLNTIKGDGLTARGKTKLDIEQSNDSTQEVESLLFYTLLPDQTEDVDEVFIMQSLSDKYGDKLIETELDKMFPDRVSYEIDGDIIKVSLSTGEIESIPISSMTNNIIKSTTLKDLAKTYIENVQRHEINMQTISRALSSNNLKIDGNLVDSEVNIKQMNTNVQKTRHLLDMSDEVAHKLADETTSDVKPSEQVNTNTSTSNEQVNANETKDEVKHEDKDEVKVEHKFKITKVLSIALVIFIVLVLGGLLLYFSLRPSQFEAGLTEKSDDQNKA